MQIYISGTYLAVLVSDSRPNRIGTSLENMQANGSFMIIKVLINLYRVKSDLIYLCIVVISFYEYAQANYFLK